MERRAWEWPGLPIHRPATHLTGVSGEAELQVQAGPLCSQDRACVTDGYDDRKQDSAVPDQTHAEAGRQATDD